MKKPHSKLTEEDNRATPALFNRGAKFAMQVGKFGINDDSGATWWTNGHSLNFNEQICTQEWNLSGVGPLCFWSCFWGPSRPLGTPSFVRLFVCLSTYYIMHCTFLETRQHIATIWQWQLTMPKPNKKTKTQLPNGPNPRKSFFLIRFPESFQDGSLKLLQLTPLLSGPILEMERWTF